MKNVNKLKARVERALAAPGDEIGRWTRFARFQVKLWRFCARRLWENNVSAMSAALSFNTIFALVPAIVLALLVLKSVGAHEDSKQALRKFMVASGFDQIVIQAEDHSADPALATQPASAPAKNINLADQIETLVAKAEAQLTFKRIGPIGAVLLIWTATGLLATLERALNRIFGARESRGITKRLILYWAALTLGPLILSAAAYLGGRLIAAIQSAGILAWIFVIFGWLGPAIVGILVVAALYKLLPNTIVRYRAAVGGALIAVPLWMLAKWGFSLYVTRFVGSGNLYGALGLIPLFLIWLNLSWTILLFGAQLAHTATNLESFEQELRSTEVEIAPLDLLAAAIAVADAYQSGAGPVPVAHVAQKLRTTERAGQELLGRLTDAGLLCPIANGEHTAYVLARPADKIAVLDIVGLRQADGASAAPADDIRQRVAGLQQQAADSLGHLTLADTLQQHAGKRLRAAD